MKIAFLSRYQNLVNRGAEVFVLELSSRLKKNHEIDILTAEADSFNKMLSGYDVVIPINGGMQSFKASLGRLFKNYKVIISGQGGVGRGEIWNIAICRPNIYVALTEYMAKWVSNWAWNSKVIKIPNGVDLSRFKPEGKRIDLNLERPIIISVGALSWYKNHQKVLDAMCYLGKGSLLIVGEGEEKDNLEKKGGKVLGDRLKILNFKHSDMPNVYRSADLFTLASWNREAFGIAYVEAMASGLGVVAPDDPSRREIVGEAGLFVNVDNPYEYAETLKVALRMNWREKGRRQAEKFSWDRIAQEYEKIICG